MSVDPTAIANAALSTPAAIRKAAKAAPTSAPVAAAGISTGAAPVTHTKRPKMTWQEAKARRESARSMVGYDNTSPIWGKTTADVVILISSVLADGTLSLERRVQDSQTLLLELQKRETAEKIAFA